MNTTWRLSSYESMTDVKELIPEFFYLPEFLVNREGNCRLNIHVCPSKHSLKKFMFLSFVQVLILAFARTGSG